MTERVEDLRKLRKYLIAQLDGASPPSGYAAAQLSAQLRGVSDELAEALRESPSDTTPAPGDCGCAARFAALLDADLERLDAAHPRRGSLGPRSHWVDECGEDGFWERVASSVGRSLTLMSMRLSR